MKTVARACRNGRFRPPSGMNEEQWRGLVMSPERFGEAGSKLALEIGNGGGLASHLYPERDAPEGY